MVDGGVDFLHKKGIIKKSPRGGTGIHAWFRTTSRKSCGFESCRGHIYLFHRHFCFLFSFDLWNPYTQDSIFH